VPHPTIVALALALTGLAAPAMAQDASELERGIARFQAGDFAASIAPLAAAHASEPADLDTSLLLGIAYYRTGDAARARPLLLAAAGSADPDTRDSAHIFLGLIADGEGDIAQARTYYDAVARSTSASSDLVHSAQQLLDRGTERFAVVAVVRPELDSNVALLPSTTTADGGGRADSDMFVLARVSVRPFRGLGLVIDQALSYRKQTRLSDYDALASVSGASWSHRGDVYRALLGYHLDLSTLGGARYQLGHTVDAAGRRALWGSFGIAVGYQLVARTLYPEAYAGYTGVTQTGTARLSWSAESLELELGYALAREQTDDATLSAVSGGGQLSGRIALGRTADLRLFTQVSDRPYDAAAMGRRDLQVRADASLYVELSSHFGMVAGGSLLHNVSSVMDLDYTKWTAYVGLIAAASR
jgi:tetratricopeptide (TPR) repeat protein